MLLFWCRGHGCSRWVVVPAVCDLLCLIRRSIPLSVVVVAVVDSPWVRTCRRGFCYSSNIVRFVSLVTTLALIGLAGMVSHGPVLLLFPVSSFRLGSVPLLSLCGLQYCRRITLDHGSVVLDLQLETVTITMALIVMRC